MICNNIFSIELSRLVFPEYGNNTLVDHSIDDGGNCEYSTNNGAYLYKEM
jgi:hypothetical protein